MKHSMPKFKVRFHGVSLTASRQRDWKFVHDKIIKKAWQEEFLRKLKPEPKFKLHQERKHAQ